MLPILRQLLVVTSTLLASASTGGVVGLPSVLLQQFKRNDSLIQVDVDTESWIASIHGVAGVSSVFVPYLMQCWGRRIGLRIGCLFMMIGWIILYFANNSKTVIIAKIFQGIANKSILIVSMTTVSEMVEPRIRNQSIVSYALMQTVIVLVVHIAGSFVHWKTLSLIMCVPVVLTIILSFTWPESPAWLACKGRFEESKKSFMWLRGKNEESLFEMNTLLNAQKEYRQAKKSRKSSSTNFWRRIRRRDFYLPTLHMFVLVSCYFWSGNLVIMIYAINLIDKVTGNSESAFISMVIVDIALIFGNICCPILLKYFDNKAIILTGGTFTILFLIGSSLVSYLQHLGLLSPDSSLCLYFLIGFMVSSSIGLYMVPFALSTEITPIKHRGVGGCVYIVFISISYTATLKAAPYLIMYLKIYGTFLLYATILSVCLPCIWLYVPETRNKTLQSIEDYYNETSKDTKKMLDEEMSENTNLNNTKNLTIT